MYEPYYFTACFYFDSPHGILWVWQPWNIKAIRSFKSRKLKYRKDWLICSISHGHGSVKCHGLNPCVFQSCSNFCLSVVPKPLGLWNMLVWTVLWLNSWYHPVTMSLLSCVAKKTSRLGENSCPLLSDLVVCFILPSWVLEISRMEREKVWPLLLQVSLCHFLGSFLERLLKSMDVPVTFRFMFLGTYILWYLCCDDCSKGRVSFCRFVEMAFQLFHMFLELNSDWQFVLWH